MNNKKITEITIKSEKQFVILALVVQNFLKGEY